MRKLIILLLLVPTLCFSAPLLTSPLPDPANLTPQQQVISSALKELAKKKATPQVKELVDTFKELKKKFSALKGQQVQLSISVPELPPKVPEKPGIYDVRKLITLGLKLKSETDSLKRKIPLDQQELQNLENAAKELYNTYIVKIQKKPYSIKSYQLLSELLFLQLRWVKLQKQLQQEEKALKNLESAFSQWQKLLEAYFKKLSVKPKEVEQLKRLVNKLKAIYDKSNREFSKSYSLYSRKITVLEARASRTRKQLLKKSYQTEIELYKTLIQTSQIRKEIAEIQYEREKFWLTLALCFSKRCPSSKALNLIEDFGKLSLQLSTEIERLNLQVKYLEQKINSTYNTINFYSLEAQNSKKLKSLYDQLIKSTNELQKNLQVLLSELLKKKEILNDFSFELNYVLPIWKARINNLAKLSSTAKNLASETGKRLISLLHYPIFKVGNEPFTPLTLIKCIITILAGLLCIKLLMRRLSAFFKNIGMDEGEAESVNTLIKYFLYLVLLLITLGIAGINLSQITIIFGALSVGIGFGLQTIANNFISGIILLVERSIKVGDIIELEDGTAGIVKRINIRSTVIRTLSALEIIVPNADMISKRISTWTYEDDWRLITVPFGVAYGSDIHRVKEIVLETAKNVKFTKEDSQHKTKVWFVEMADSSLNFVLAVWVRLREINVPLDEVKDSYLSEIYDALNQNGIEIPFPQLDIHVKDLPQKKDE